AGLFCRSGSPPVWSLLLLPLCFVWFAIFGVCSISGKSLNRSIVSKLFPLSDNPIIQAIQNDRYYCFLAPLTLPALLVAVYFHWLSMKLFKHA
ncbi:hypothetical protein ISN44_As11g002380, partial [Arabidopsis suecica]